MIDRFGLLPEPTKNLMRLTSLKLHAEKLGIKKVDAGPTVASSSSKPKHRSTH